MPGPELNEINNLSIEKRRSEIVENAIDELVQQGKSSFKPGDVAELLRQKNDPIGIWQLRSEFSVLEEKGAISFDADTALWARIQRSKIKERDLA